MLRRSRLLLGVIAACLAQSAQAKDWVVVSNRGILYHVLIWDKKNERNEAVYKDAITNICGANSEKHCILQFWADRRYIPPCAGLDPQCQRTDAQANAQTVNYTNNPHNGYRQFLWNCRLRPELTRDKCF